MRTLPQNFQIETELEIKRSRFITNLARTPSESEAREFIDQIRSRYPDARHHCTAFIVRNPDAHDIERSSDDGEPSGTAGAPLLETLKGAELTEVTVVVTRYFGGILLGTGGLVRAYTDAANQAINASPKMELRPLALFEVKAPHAIAGKISAWMLSQGYEVIDTQYQQEAVFQVLSEISAQETLCENLLALSQGEVTPVKIGTQIGESPVHS
ncbi:YigZ family protein [Boudabousia liubingyangii]|uniref:YigZ family protein n=1 Tax=Boudabousia liubingyangii TaxID=1921764 RepID=UPI00093D2293|nr:YigZ family protein [Boudabousia liubingyangii]OKL47435.1 YigZ family protein [Boudabousia liubingyangii]